jgi:hypothetical protein
MPKVEDLSGEEIDKTVSRLRKAVREGKVRRASEAEVMQTRLSALESMINAFRRDLDAFCAVNPSRRRKKAADSV